MKFLSLSYTIFLIILYNTFSTEVTAQVTVKVISRTSTPILSYIDKTSVYQQIFNPTYVQANPGTGGKKGILARTQNCTSVVGGKCVFCGGSMDKASFLTFSEELGEDKFQPVTNSSIVFGPHDSSDSWGTEDPRIQYNPHDQLYYMFYTAFNGSSILLNLATSPNPTSPDQWTRHGPVYPNIKGSKSAALLLRDSPPHYLLWGDSNIRIAKSNDPLVWIDAGAVLLSPRPGSFDSALVESGPPPLSLSNGNYLFFYNSAQSGWPNNPITAYHAGWLILDANDPTKILQRSSEPLLGPEYPWEKGTSPYTCNAPNVVFLEAAYPLGQDRFRVFFGGSDTVIGSAVIEVSSP